MDEPAAPPPTLAEHAPEFVAAVDSGATDDRRTILTTVAAFGGRPDLLTAALEYAHARGVAVTFAPSAAAAAAAADPAGLRELVTTAMPFAAHAGVEITAASAAEVRGQLAWAAERCTTGGILHGGALMTLGDTLGACVAFLNLPPGAGTATVESKTNFFRGVRDGHVEGVGRPLHVGRTVIVVQTDLYDGRGRRVGQVTQTQAVLAPQ